MDAKDFRKGNIIQNDALDIFKKGFIEIHARHIFEIAVKESAQIYNEYVDSFKPILLTEEWLLKFGFYKQSIGYSKLTEMRELFNISFGKHTQINSISFNNEIKYVHQLQNLYFALTGEELNPL